MQWLNIGLTMVDYPRFERWVNVSHALARFHPFLVILVQGLGRLDAKLIFEDTLQLPENTQAEIEMAALRRTENHTLSYLWVLGAYELVRTIAEKSRQDPSLQSSEAHHLLSDLEVDLERLRIPLAKLEPAKRHKNTDFSIAFPATHPKKGFAWQVAEGVYISRRDLADSLLHYVEMLQPISEHDPSEE